MSRTFVEITGRRLPLSNLEKELYPSYGFTKARILDYYREMASFILPHVKDRALTFKRYPEGVEKDFFFEKRCPVHRPAWVTTADIPQDGAALITSCLVNDLATLMWVENLASIELHVPLAKAGSPQTPDAMVFDLDPGMGAGMFECVRVALILRNLLSRLELSSSIKTSGGKGLHLYVPLNRADMTFEDTKTFSRAVADIMQKKYPALVTAKMGKRERNAKVFINWSQNDASKTMISVYSLRARERPFVSFPLEWSRLESSMSRNDADNLQVTHADALSRAEKTGDLFQDVLVREQKLPHL